MNKKVLVLSLMTLLPFAAMAAGIQDDTQTERTVTTSSSMVAQPQPAPMQKDWHHDNRFDEAFQNHPLTMDQKQRIKAVMEESRQSTKDKVDAILTPEQQQDWTNYQSSHKMMPHPMSHPMMPPQPPEPDSGN